jgi:hypothetical protein
MGTYGHVLIQIFSAKTAVCPLYTLEFNRTTNQLFPKPLCM